MSNLEALPGAFLPDGVRARFIDDVNGLRMHVLEAGFEDGSRPMILLVHGFPELAYSWRKIIPALAAAGYHVVAPDLRGYGRTADAYVEHHDDVEAFRILSLVTDLLALVGKLGRTSVAAIVGHDFGSPISAWCALARPDVFRSVVLMSAPFGGSPSLTPPALPDVHRDLAALPRPRKHYVRYYATREANADLMQAPQGLHAFLRAYYHVKSADWTGDQPFPLQAYSAAELARLPTYYVMDLAANMAETVAPDMPSDDAIAACQWLTEAELAVYVAEFERTGFQGGLNYYRGAVEPGARPELVFAGRTIDAPSTFIAGASDWGIHQTPGAFKAMTKRTCTQFRGAHLIDGAGHWVQQEKPDEVSRLILDFLNGLRAD